MKNQISKINLNSFLCLLCFCLILIFTNEAIGQNSPPEIEEPSLLEDILAILFLIALIVGGIYVYRLYKKYTHEPSKEEELQELEKISIENFVEENNGKVVGKVLPQENLLVAPFTGRKCVYYHVTLKHYEYDDPYHGLDDGISGGKKGKIYKTILQEIDSHNFYIADESGLAEIQPKGAVVMGDIDMVRKTGFFKRPNGLMKAFLKKYNVKIGMFGKFKFEECVLEINESVTVVGQGKWEDTTDPSRQNTYPKTLVFRHSQEFPLHLSDKF